MSRLRVPSLPGRSLIALLVACAPSAAIADEGTTAEALFRAGREAVTRGDYATACAKFAESERMEPAAGTLLNLGECSEKLGRSASAWKSYTEAADRLEGDSRREYAIQRRDELAGKLAKLRVLVESPPPACVLSVDGTHLGQAGWGEPLPIDPGDHLVELKCPDRLLSTAKSHVDESAAVDVHIAAGAPAPKATKPNSAMLAAGGTVTALGVASLAVGFGAGALVLSKKSTIDSVCTHTTPPRCPPEGVQAAKDGKVLSTVSTATFVSGVVLAGVGVTLIVVGVTSKSASPTVAVSVRAGSLSGLEVRGAF